MSFKIIDKKLLKKYTKIWESVSSLNSIGLDSEPVYGDNSRCIKTKIKSDGDKVNTNFQGKKMSKENASYKYLPLIMLDSVISVNKKYYYQRLLEECKYEILKKKQFFSDDLDFIWSDDESNHYRMVSLMMNLIVNVIINLLRIKNVFY